MNKPKMSVREFITNKGRVGRKHEANFQKKLKAAPKRVQHEYYLCETQIDRFDKFLDECPSDKPIQEFKQILHAPGKGSLTETQIVQLHELLHLKYESSNIMLIAALKWRDKGRRPLGLLFCYTPIPKDWP